MITARQKRTAKQKRIERYIADLKIPPDSIPGFTHACYRYRSFIWKDDRGEHHIDTHIPKLEVVKPGNRCPLCKTGEINPGDEWCDSCDKGMEGGHD